MGFGLLRNSFFIFLFFCAIARAEDQPCHVEIESVRSETLRMKSVRTILGEVLDEKNGFYSLTYISNNIGERSIFIDSVLPSRKGCTLQKVKIGIHEKNFNNSCDSSHPDYLENKVGKYFYRQLKYKPKYLEVTLATAPASDASCYFYSQYLYKGINEVKGQNR